MSHIELLFQNHGPDYALNFLKDLNITIKEYDNFYMLSYSHINSIKFNKYSDECSSLILDRNTYKIASRAFDRFYNYNQDPDSDKFDLMKAKVYEKVDGSLIQCWWNKYKNDWIFSTRKMLYSEGPTDLNNTFYHVIKKAFKNNINSFKNLLCNTGMGYTYIFEVVSPETKVVKTYPEYDIYYLGRRNLLNHKEELIEEAPIFLQRLEYIKFPRVYTFKTNEEIFESVNKLPNLEEGYVCCNILDDRIWRIKIKNLEHLAAAQLDNNGVMSLKKIAFLVYTGNYEEHVNYFPECKIFYEPYIKALELFKKDCLETKNILNQINDRRTRAETAYKINKKIGMRILSWDQNRYPTLDEFLEDSFNLNTQQPNKSAIFQTLTEYVGDEYSEVINKIKKKAAK